MNSRGLSFTKTLSLQRERGKKVPRNILEVSVVFYLLIVEWEQSEDYLRSPFIGALHAFGWEDWLQLVGKTYLLFKVRFAPKPKPCPFSPAQREPFSS